MDAGGVGGVDVTIIIFFFFFCFYAPFEYTIRMLLHNSMDIHNVLLWPLCLNRELIPLIANSLY
jgi:hypothetical protein